MEIVKMLVGCLAIIGLAMLVIGFPLLWEHQQLKTELPELRNGVIVVACVALALCLGAGYWAFA